MKHFKTHSRKPHLFATVASALALTASIMAQDEGKEMASQSKPDGGTAAANDISMESLERLMTYEITSVSKISQPLFTTPAAVHVITGEDIRRSGVTSIAEALRMAPGLQVAQLDARNHAISSRGFNDYFANKLLVLIDGRSVYTPLFSGVFWDVQDTALMDIDRIEVIRGPGAALWGANAVNGVINIITKHTKDTQGGYIEAGAGTEERGFSTLRYGGKISEDAYYRVYAKYSNRDETRTPGGGRAADSWDMWRAGFRSDWKANDFNDFTFQGDVYSGEYNQEVTVFPPPTFFRQLSGEARVEGGNLLGAWTHKFSSEADFRLQGYYDRTERFDRVHHETRNTFDLDFQQRLAMLPRQEILIGGNYRYTEDKLSDGRDNTGTIWFFPPKQGYQLFSAFLQDQITVVEDRVQLTLGSKFEHNDYTGFEVQPNARLAYTPNKQNTLWAAVSRAVRTPSRFEHTIETAIPPVVLVGNSDYRSEELMAYEIGYRIAPIDPLSFDLAAFYNDYEKLRIIGPSGFRGPIPLFTSINEMEGQTYGGELSVNWNVRKEWRLAASYTLLQMELQSATPSNEAIERGDPQNQFQIRSMLDLPHNVQLDTSLYYVDRLASRSVPSYFKLDQRIGWQPINNLDISVVFQNLLDSQHPEFASGFLYTAREIERSVYGKVTWRF